MKRRRGQLAAGVAACAVLAGCTGVTSGRGVAGGPGGTSPGGSASSAPPAACPSTYAAPDPNRPKVELGFTVSSDLTSVRGTEHVAFTPDVAITELVFRLTANTPPTVAAGTRIVVTSARADHGGGLPTYDGSGADPTTQGGLLRIPFTQQVAAGTTVTADLEFTLTVGPGTFDRYGRTGDGANRYAWFGTAQPLLAWERGFGWHKEELLKFVGESATSEAMDTDLTVSAPAAATVIMSGDPTTATTAGANRVWHARIGAARDVSVAVGPFAVSDTVVEGVHLRVGAFNPRVRDELVPEFRRAITQLVSHFGPYPFPSLSVARLPAEGGGIEYPSAILLLSHSRLVVVHETAHQWFYAMVGNSQALHPWLDEAFAVYAEELVDGTQERTGTLTSPGTVDKSTESYGDDVDDYYFVTYSKGAAALQAARAEAGAAGWDAAVRCYINKNAWRIADPSDFAAAIRQFPKATAVLTQAGALP
jgi:hypothetical protein